MPLAPPVIKIVLLLSFITTYLLDYGTIDKVARKLSAARHKHSVPRMHGETARQGGVRRPAVPEIRGPGCTGRPRVRAAYAVQPCPRYAARSGRLSSTFPHDVIGTVAPQSKTPGFGALRTLLIGWVCISPLVEFTRPPPGG